MKIDFYLVPTTPKTAPETLTITLLEKQQLPDLGRTDSESEISCLKWTKYDGRIKVCANFKTDTDKLIFILYGYRNKSYLRDYEIDLKLTEYQLPLANQVYLLSNINFF